MRLIVFTLTVLLSVVAIASGFFGVKLLIWQIITYLDKGVSPQFTGIDVIKSAATALPYDPLLKWAETPENWIGVHNILLQMPGWGLLLLTSFLLLMVCAKIFTEFKWRD